MKKLWVFSALLMAMTVDLARAEVPNCARAADIAAAIRAGNLQRAQDLAVNATALEIQTAQIGERRAPANLGPAEVRDGVLRACLKSAR